MRRMFATLTRVQFNNVSAGRTTTRRNAERRSSAGTDASSKQSSKTLKPVLKPTFRAASAAKPENMPQKPCALVAYLTFAGDVYSMASYLRHPPQLAAAKSTNTQKFPPAKRSRPP
ncbi:unnamed protein product [Chondrus crispus]|uniref:Uncharacterized protein n=1 Tax=Chondrus crispus TaxID=2769 RepID=R7QR61_CHOCR|nr:unnamed protein product [Chondrus crispus]CDF39961.1 unnamed protein product [Chondrus crispus]|eukprot:XP_005710255.1 unnamed protein product [Chondrus crispus]